MTYQEDYNFYNRYMLEDEYILWQGSPAKGNIFTKRDLIMVPFSIMWLSFAVFWELSAIKTTHSPFLMLWGLPFILVGLYMLFGRFIQTAYLRNKTFYVITNKKIIIKRGSRISLHDGRDLPPMDIEIHKNGNGTIFFIEEVYTRSNRRHRTYFMLENLPDVAQAQNAVSMMER